MKKQILALLAKTAEIVKKSKIGRSECHSIDALNSEQQEIRSRVGKMRATINGEDRWMLTLKERH
jgi:hypothetical protein